LASVRDLELNEAGWWAHWTDIHWVGDSSYVMSSPTLDEHFFNRAVFVDCSGAREAIPKLEAELTAAGRPPCFSVQDRCQDVAEELVSLGYDTFDWMVVMQLDQPRFRTAPGLTILSGKDVPTADWAASYSLSFYGDFRMRDSVSTIAERLGEEPSVTLFAGKKDGRISGVLAAFRTPGLLGAYCIGTIEKDRRMGVAGSLIQQASALASAEGRALVLQTISSERVEDFYAMGGFRRLYTKHLMGRGTPS
jgi:hypothetical protein